MLVRLTSLSIKAPALVTFVVVTKLVIPEPSPLNPCDAVIAEAVTGKFNSILFEANNAISKLFP